jgi:hypothetical protein
VASRTSFSFSVARKLSAQVIPAPFAICYSPLP